MNTKNYFDKRYLEIILNDHKIERDSWTGQNLCLRKEIELIDLGSPQAQVVMGVRRSGKSTLCMQSLCQSGIQFAYVDFDDERLMGLKTPHLNDILEILYKLYGDLKFVFFDEIQNVEGWPLFVNRLLRNRIHVVLTGSNAKLLSTDLATHLTGRSSEIHLYPFTFLEYCFARGIDCQLRSTKGIAGLRNAFDNYLKTGGFPELGQIKNKKRYISNLVDNILKRDIEQRFHIAYPAQFENMAHHILNISPCTVSTADLAEIFNFKSLHTVRNYVSHLKQAYVLIGVKKYSAKSKMRFTQEKLYAVDVALMDRRENALAGDNLGWRLETIVLSHLMRHCQYEGRDVYYLKERAGECDFIVCDGNRVLQCIQVSYDISSDKTYRREINGLLLANKRTKCDNLLLLTDHEYKDVEENGQKISIRPVYEWCLDMFNEGMAIQ